jgi:hypothetical protein
MLHLCEQQLHKCILRINVDQSSHESQISFWCHYFLHAQDIYRMRKDVSILLLVCLAFLAVTPFVVSKHSRMLWMRTTEQRKILKTSPPSKIETPYPPPTISQKVQVHDTAHPPLSNGSLTSLSLYRPPAEHSTVHYNYSVDVMPDEFLEHLQHMVRKISKKWKSAGWHRYEKEDISKCDTATPECTLFRTVTGPADGPVIHKRAYMKCCVEHRLLREVAVWTLSKLNEANITHFLSTGTALGAIRHNGVIIPWDTDIDIAVFPADKPKIEALFSNNGEHFFHKDTLGKPMYWVHHSRTGKPAGGPHVEIFFDPVYTNYPQKLLPLETCNMYEHTVMCPNRKMFEVWFPSGWGVYGGGHYHGPNRCTIYRNGNRYEQNKC